MYSENEENGGEGEGAPWMKGKEPLFYAIGECSLCRGNRDRLGDLNGLEGAPDAGQGPGVEQLQAEREGGEAWERKNQSRGWSYLGGVFEASTV